MDRLGVIRKQIINYEDAITKENQEKRLEEGELYRIRNFSYFIAKPHHRQELQSLIISARSKNNPIVAAFLKFQPHYTCKDSQKKHWEEKVKKFVSNNTSIICCDRNKNNEIVANSCGVCYATAYQESFASECQGDQFFESFSALYKTLSQQISEDIKEKLNIKGLVCELGGCSAKEGTEKGIFRKTVPLLFYLAANNGFKYIFSFVANSRTRKIFETMNMSPIAQVDLWQFEHNGEKPFAAVDKQNRFPCFMWKQIA